MNLPEAAQHSHEAATKALHDQKEVQKAIDVHFVPLINKADAWSALTGKEHADALLPVAKQSSEADDSLILSLTSSVAKAPTEHGEFDSMVLEQVRKDLADKVVELIARQEAEAEKQNILVAAVQVSQSPIGKLQGLEVAVANELGSAMGAASDASALFQKAKEAQAAFEPQLTTATNTRDENQFTIRRFQEVVLRLRPFRPG